MSNNFDLTKQAAAWHKAGIIDNAQAIRIVAFEAAAASEHQADAEVVDAPVMAHPGHARDRMQAVVGMIGVLLIGLGILLLVITNWDSISDPGKIALLVITLGVSYAIALIADARKAASWVSTSALVVGMLTFSAGIFVVAETYNVRVHDPLGFLLIAVIGTGVALASRRSSVGWIAALGWGGWILHEIFVAFGKLDDKRLVVAALACATIAAVGALAIGWALEHLEPARVVVWPVRFLATGGLLVALTVASFAWHSQGHMLHGGGNWGPWLVLALALVELAAMWKWVPFARGGLMTGALAVVAMGVAVLSVWPNDIAITIAANAALALGGFGLVLLGLVESNRESYSWGIAWLTVLVVVRYFDFIASVDLGGFGFIGAGVLLVIVAVLIGRSRGLWRRRREVLS